MAWWTTRADLIRETRVLRTALEDRLAEVIARRESSTATVARLPVTVAARALIADVAGSLPMESIRDGAPVLPTPTLLVRPDPAMTLRRWNHRAAMSLTGAGNLFVLPFRMGSNDWPLAADVIPPARVSWLPEPTRPWEVGGWSVAGVSYARGDLIHVPLWELDLDQAVAPSPLAACQAAFDDLAEMWAFAAGYWTEGGKPPYALKYPSRLDARKAAAALDQWVNARRARRPGLLTGAWEIQDLTVPTAQDSLLLDGLAYIDQAVARIYGIPPTLLNVRAETGSLTYTNTRDEVARWLVLSLGPTWLARVQDAYTLMLPAGQQARFVTATLGLAPAGLDEGAPADRPAPQVATPPPPGPAPALADAALPMGALL